MPFSTIGIHWPSPPSILVYRARRGPQQVRVAHYRAKSQKGLGGQHQELNPGLAHGKWEYNGNCIRRNPRKCHFNPPYTIFPLMQCEIAWVWLGLSRWFVPSYATFPLMWFPFCDFPWTICYNTRGQNCDWIAKGENKMCRMGARVHGFGRFWKEKVSCWGIAIVCFVGKRRVIEKFKADCKSQSPPRRPVRPAGCTRGRRGASERRGEVLFSQPLPCLRQSNKGACLGSKVFRQVARALQDTEDWIYVEFRKDLRLTLRPTKSTTFKWF